MQKVRNLEQALLNPRMLELLENSDYSYIRGYIVRVDFGSYWPGSFVKLVSLGYIKADIIYNG